MIIFRIIESEHMLYTNNRIIIGVFNSSKISLIKILMIRTYVMLSYTAYHIQIFRIIDSEQMLYTNNCNIIQVLYFLKISPIKL
jgi:hypothetical protein